MYLSSASRSLRSSFGHWLVAEFSDRVSELEESDFFYCTLFAQHGGLDMPITIERSYRKDAKVLPLDVIDMVDNRRFWNDFIVFYHFAQDFPCFLGSILCRMFSCLQAASLLKDNAETEDLILAGFLRVLRTLEGAVRRWQLALAIPGTHIQCWPISFVPSLLLKQPDVDWRRGLFV